MVHALSTARHDLKRDAGPSAPVKILREGTRLRVSRPGSREEATRRGLRMGARGRRRRRRGSKLKRNGIQKEREEGGDWEEGNLKEMVAEG